MTKMHRTAFKKTCNKLALLAVALFPLVARAGDAPSISPSDSQYVVIDTSNDTHVFLSASGGTTDQPDSSQGTAPWTSDPIQYKWDYSGLSGNPSSGTLDDGGSLQLDITIGGQASVSVSTSQVWHDCSNNSVTQTGPSSSSVFVKVQVPTSITYNNSQVVTGGAAFNFTMHDQDGQTIDNSSVAQHETVIGNDVLHDLSGARSDVTVPLSGTGNAATSTGAGGAFSDSPVGEDEADLVTIANMNQASVRSTFNCTPHEYDYAIASGSFYPDVFNQTQQVVQVATYVNSSTTPTVATTSRSPL